MRRNFEAEIALAQRASQSGIAELLASQEAKVLSGLTAKYRAGTLTPEDAKVGIALISEFRSLAGNVDRTIERGSDAVDQMTRTPR